MRKQFTIFLILIFILGLAPINFASAQDLSNRLSGRILLQVEDVGQAWYIDPGTKQRAFLGRPADAFQIMRELGLGISEKDYESFNKSVPEKLSGKILLRVEANGEAYYVNPTDLKMYYLGRPADAFNIMRNLGLGISNKDINQISIFSKNATLMPIDDIWNKYCNSYFGFCINLPKKQWGKYADNHDCGNIIVNEYNDRVEIVGENPKEYCKYSCFKMCNFWIIYASRVNDDKELRAFINDRWGGNVV